MRGAHSIKKKRKRGPLIAAVIVIIALAATAALCVAAHKSPVSLVTDAWSLLVETHDPSSAQDDAIDESSSADLDQQDQQRDEPDEDLAALVVDGLYENPRFGFELAIPDGFEIVSALPNDEGVVIESASLQMTVEAKGENNAGHADANSLLTSIWNGSEDSISRAQDNRVVIYQYDDDYEYFYWIDVGPGSINRLEIRYPLQDENREELDAAQALMQGFIAGDLEIEH